MLVAQFLAIKKWNPGQVIDEYGNACFRKNERNDRLLFGLRIDDFAPDEAAGILLHRRCNANDNITGRTNSNLDLSTKIVELIQIPFVTPGLKACQSQIMFKALNVLSAVTPRITQEDMLRVHRKCPLTPEYGAVFTLTLILAN